MTIKASAILVDRLAHALESHGVEMKRRALLETAAYAFAYSSSNAFTAASAAGDINPPPVTVIGRLELPVAAGARRERVRRRGARTVSTARARGRAAQRRVPGLKRRPQLLAPLR